MTPLSFEKWEGLGNDFIVIDRDKLSIEDARRLAPTWCDRRFGVGGDGILLVGERPASMVVINADGSRPEMCGNGIRCVAGHLSNTHGAPPARILSDAGERPIEVHAITSTSADVSVDMGTPSFTPSDAGVTLTPSANSSKQTDAGQTDAGQTDAGQTDAGQMGAGQMGAPLPDDNSPSPTQLSHELLPIPGYLVSVGNPHWIFIGEERRDVAEFGPQLERDSRFANRTNVEWVTPLGERHYRVDVWERGAGQTLACGTGAAAVGYLLHQLNGYQPESPIRITLPGGDLVISVEKSGRTWMRGPAYRVFSGVIDERLMPE